MIYLLLFIAIECLLIFLSIKLGLFVFRQPIRFDQKKDRQLILPKDGYYEIWIRLKTFQFVSRRHIQITLKNSDTDEVPLLYRPLTLFQASSFSERKVRCYIFYGTAGTYSFEVEKTVKKELKTLSAGSFYIKDKPPFFLLPIFILLCGLSLTLVILGIVFILLRLHI